VSQNSTLHFPSLFYTLLVRLLKSKSHWDWRSVSHSASKSWCQAQSGANDQIFITVCIYGLVFVGAPPLMRGRICLLYMLLALASTVSLGSESLGTCDHILLSSLPTTRWRYSTPPPHGFRSIDLLYPFINAQHAPHGKCFLHC
jgi:hypothetical protein